MLMDWPSKSIWRLNWCKKNIWTFHVLERCVFLPSIEFQMMNIEYETLFSDVLWMIMVYNMVLWLLWKVSAFILTIGIPMGIKKTLKRTAVRTWRPGWLEKPIVSFWEMGLCLCSVATEASTKAKWRLSGGKNPWVFFGFMCILFCWQMLFWRILISGHTLRCPSKCVCLFVGWFNCLFGGLLGLVWFVLVCFGLFWFVLFVCLFVCLNIRDIWKASVALHLPVWAMLRSTVWQAWLTQAERHLQDFESEELAVFPCSPKHTWLQFVLFFQFNISLLHLTPPKAFQMFIGLQEKWDAFETSRTI